MSPLTELAAELRQLSYESAQSLLARESAFWTADRGAGRWVAIEILGHLCDSAINNHQRFVRAMIEGGVEWPGYAQDDMVRVQGFLREDPHQVVRLWQTLNMHLAHVMEQMKPEQMQYACVIGKSAPVTLEWLARDYVRHLKHHLKEIV